ncbi:MAG: imidazole glycerol phosphate synthase subunit HisH [Chloroflexi bacterium]|nr:imidazole glycerol phosphate synthase subunit HisH [Chloroflexota bacterium]
MIAIIDYGAGNLRSVANAVAKLGYEAKVTGNPDHVLWADAVILPGVGAAGYVMQRMETSGMSRAVRQLVADGRPLFAVCVGMQVLFEATEEGGRHECLGIIPGTVKRLPSGLKVPHIGWNQVKQSMRHPVFDGIPDESNFYFVHS